MATTPVSPIEYYNSDVTAFVTSLYQDFINRTPDAGGLTYWTNDIQNGGDTYIQVILDFINSSEFTKSLSNTTQFVQALYADILGRSASASEVSYWASLIQNNTLSKNQVATDFVTSSEFSKLESTHTASLHASATNQGSILLSAEGGGFRAFTADSAMFAGVES